MYSVWAGSSRCCGRGFVDHLRSCAPGTGWKRPVPLWQDAETNTRTAGLTCVNAVLRLKRAAQEIQACALPLNNMRCVQVRRDQYLVRCHDRAPTQEPRVGYLGWRPAAKWVRNAMRMGPPGPVPVALSRPRCYRRVQALVPVARIGTMCVLCARGVACVIDERSFCPRILDVSLRVSSTSPGSLEFPSQARTGSLSLAAAALY